MCNTVVVSTVFIRQYLTLEQILQPDYIGHGCLHTVQCIFMSICYIETCQTKHQCAYTRNTVTYSSCHTGHCDLMYLHRHYDTSHHYFVCISQRYIDTPIHGIPSFHILLSSLHGFSACHCYTCMHGFYMDHRSYCMSHSCIPVT